MIQLLVDSVIHWTNQTCLFNRELIFSYIFNKFLKLTLLIDQAIIFQYYVFRFLSRYLSYLNIYLCAYIRIYGITCMLLISNWLYTECFWTQCQNDTAALEHKNKSKMFNPRTPTRKNEIYNNTQCGSYWRNFFSNFCNFLKNWSILTFFCTTFRNFNGAFNENS